MIKNGDVVEVVNLKGIDDRYIRIGDTYQVFDVEIYPDDSYEFDVELRNGITYTMCDLDVSEEKVKIIKEMSAKEVYESLIDNVNFKHSFGVIPPHKMN